MDTKQYTQEQEQIARIAKAMGHPARMAILYFLARQESCYFGDIHEELPISKATVSQHLKELKNAGLIKGNFEGNTICYCLNQAGFDKIKQFFQHINVYFETPKDQCC